MKEGLCMSRELLPVQLSDMSKKVEKFASAIPVVVYEYGCKNCPDERHQTVNVA